MSCKDTEINVFYTKTRDILLSDVVELLKESSEIVELLTAKKHKWYFTGQTKKEALKNEFFHDSEVTEHALQRMKEEKNKNDFIINESIWDGMPENESSSISHFMTSMMNRKKGNINIVMIGGVTASGKMVSAISRLASKEWNSWVAVETNGYSFYNHNVFPDRIHVGWMLFIPHVVQSHLIKEAASVVSVLDDNGNQKGTIIISTEDVFDGSKKEHIEKSNDIEIRLLDLGLLPLMTEL